MKNPSPPTNPLAPWPINPPHRRYSKPQLILLPPTTPYLNPLQNKSQQTATMCYILLLQHKCRHLSHHEWRVCEIRVTEHPSPKDQALCVREQRSREDTETLDTLCKACIKETTELERIERKKNRTIAGYEGGIWGWVRGGR